MITAKQVLIDYLEAQENVEEFCEATKLSKQTFYNIKKGENVSSEVMAKLLSVSGFDFEKAFEVEESK